MDDDLQFQSRSSRRGKELEDSVAAVLDEVGLLYDRNFKVPAAGVSADFRISIPDGPNIYIECKGGELVDTSVPSARRSDNVKKAIANAALIKEIEPCVFWLLFSWPPKSDSVSLSMLDCASLRIIDGWFLANDSAFYDYLERVRDEWIGR